MTTRQALTVAGPKRGWPTGRGRLRIGAVAILTVVGVTLVAAPPTMAATVHGSSDGITATMTVGTHHPKVDQKWPLSFTVTHAGRSVKASLSYEWLYGGQVVAHRDHYTFTGHFSEVFQWPAEAVGEPLTFRAVIVSGKATINLDYAVQVIK